MLEFIGSIIFGIASLFGWAIILILGSLLVCFIFPSFLDYSFLYLIGFCVIGVVLSALLEYSENRNAKKIIEEKKQTENNATIEIHGNNVEIREGEKTYTFTITIKSEPQNSGTYSNK